LAKLRPLLDVGHAARLVTDRERIAFVPHGADVDVNRLATLASDGVSGATNSELKMAAALFSGEFAEGLDLPACFRFHEWCTAEREKWAALRLAILKTLVERLHDTPEDALVYARSRVSIDPLDEKGHIDVIRLLVALGRQREALRQYDYCREVLEAELGARPGAELERALAAFKPPSLARIVAKQRAASAPSPLRVAEPELVGRDGECSALDEIATNAAASGVRPKLVLLTGEPGIGKSRLLRYCHKSIVNLGGEVLAARAFEAEMRRPFGIWADILKGVRTSTIAAATRAQLRPLIFDAAGAPASKEGDRVQLFAAVVSLLAELASRAPLAVLIDDLQWVDEPSVSLLHYVIRAFDAPCRLMLAATVRRGELSDNEPTHRFVRGLAREQRLREMPLGPLDELASMDIAKSIAPNIDVASVVATSEGNPLFTLELARALANGESAVPETIESVLAELLSRPEGPARALLPWAAALGREFDSEVLTRCVRLSPSEWDDALEELERRGIIRCSGEACYDFSHDLIRSAAYGRISQPRRRLIHSQIAQSIAATLDPNEGVPALATELSRHAELGGNKALAARGCFLAGEHSLRVFANDEAIDFARRGLRHLTGMEPGPDRARLHIALLKVQVLASPGSRLLRWPNLLGELSNAVAAAELLDLKADAATGYYLLSVLHQDQGDAARAQATTLRAAEAGRDAGSATAAAQFANTARCLIELESDVGRSRTLLAEAGAIFGQSGSKNAEFYWSEALLKRWDGGLDAALPFMEEALQVARSDRDRWRECKCLAWLAVINLELGEPEATLACCEELGPLAAKMGESGELPFVHALEALARLSLRLPNAAPALVSAVDQLRAFDSKAHLAYVLNAAAEIAFAAGNLSEARAAAQDALVAAEATRRRCEAFSSRALLAQVLAAQGDPSGARGWLDPLLARVAEPDSLSARARSAGLRAADALGLRIPTVDQTLSR
jgi:DNA-binding SARP family transcriptional activator